MKLIDTSQLNRMLKSVPDDYQKELIYANHFFRGVEEIKKRYPFSTVCLIASEKVFNDKGKRFISILNAYEVKCETVIINNYVDSIDNAKEIVKTKDNVRALITFEHDFLGLLKYCCMVKGADAFYLCDDGNFDNVFSDSYYLLNKDKYDKVKVDCNLTVIFDCNKLTDGQIIGLYVNCVSHIIDFIDLTINYLSTDKKISKSVFRLLSHSLNSTVNIFESKENIRKKTLCYNLLYIETANYLSRQDVFTCSGIKGTELIYRLKNKKETPANVKMQMLNLLLKLYDLALQKKVLLNTENYNELVKEVTDIIAVNRQFLLDKIQNNNKKYDYVNNKNLLRDKKLVALFNSVFSNFSKINSTYIALGGILAKENLSDVIKLCDMVTEFNGLSVLRAQGLLTV